MQFLYGKKWQRPPDCWAAIGVSVMICDGMWKWYLMQQICLCKAKLCSARFFIQSCEMWGRCFGITCQLDQVLGVNLNLPWRLQGLPVSLKVFGGCNVWWWSFLAEHGAVSSGGCFRHCHCCGSQTKLKSPNIPMSMVHSNPNTSVVGNGDNFTAFFFI